MNQGHQSMSWNYRIVRYRNGTGFGLHEVYYNEEGKAWGMTKRPISFSIGKGEGAKSICESLRRAIACVETKPVFTEPKKWAKRLSEPEETSSRPKRSHQARA